MKKELKIFVSAYACEPNLGSEIGVGWHWVLEMSKYFKLWILTRKSNQATIETWLENNPTYKNIHFIYFDLPYYLRFWKKGMRGVRLYYNIWQWNTNRIVKKTMLENKIQVFHHLTYGNVLWSVSKFGKKQFFVWGPVGGVETIASEYSKHYKIKGRLIESLRRVIVKSLSFNLGYKNRCKNADLILCKTEILKDKIPLKHKEKAQLFTDVAVDELSIISKNKKESKSHIVKYIAVGKLDPWRGFDLLIEAFSLAVKSNQNIQLQIIGKGLDWNRLNSLIIKSELSDYIKILGEVSMHDYKELMANSDIVVNPCLKEGAVTTAFDAMAMGKPLICTDTTGYTRYFSSDYAILIPIGERNDLISDLNSAILKLTNDQLRKEMGENAKNVREQFTWEIRGQEIYSVIASAYKNNTNRK